jgi:hypothetical protein
MIGSQLERHGALTLTDVAEDEPHLSIQFYRPEIERFNGEPNRAKFEVVGSLDRQAR